MESLLNMDSQIVNDAVKTTVAEHLENDPFNIKDDNATAIGAIAEDDVQNNSVIDSLIDLLPFEMNFPGLEFCGPGSHLEERLNRGEQGVNQLDKACLQHDLVYAAKDKDRRKADRILADKAFSRMLSFDAEPDERTAALVTACCMISKITFEKFFERIQKAIGLNKKKKNKIPADKKKQIKVVVHKERSKQQKKNITKKNKKKNGKNIE